MMILSGAPSLSPFRREKLLTKLRESDASIQSVCAEYVHFAELCKPLTPAETITLEALLTYGPSQQKADKRGQLLLVAPRPGTISPWSSKATDIAHNCGLQTIIRLERGTAYYIEASTPLSEQQLTGLGELLRDRMVESVFGELEQARALFSNNLPAPVSVVDVVNGGSNALTVANVSLG